MSANDQMIQKFIDLIESAISIANSLKVKGASADRIDASIKTLQNFRNLASSGAILQSINVIF